ncbi:hypothetical protein NC652_008176 [Populus alba x Populus x berolinensis]|nr:hypothetical protein NC652_008176 [Populus alba x Populus x berolinensis]
MFSWSTIWFSLDACINGNAQGTLTIFSTIYKYIVLQLQRKLKEAGKTPYMSALCILSQLIVDWSSVFIVFGLKLFFFIIASFHVLFLVFCELRVFFLCIFLRFKNLIKDQFNENLMRCSLIL